MVRVKTRLKHKHLGGGDATQAWKHSKEVNSDRGDIFSYWAYSLILQML